MENLMERLQHLLAEQFPGSVIELEQAYPEEKISGFVIWDGFEDMETLDRQTRVSQVLKENLIRDDQLRVSIIFALTPVEVSAMKEG